METIRPFGEEVKGEVTVFGFARLVIWLQQIALHTAAGVRPLSVHTGLAAGPINCALVEI